MKTNTSTMKLLWVVSAALVVALAPGLATAQSAESGGPSEVGTLRFGGTLGLALGDQFTGFGIKPQFSYTAAELDRNLYLDIAGHIGFTLGGGSGYSAHYYEVVPAARLRYAVSPKVALYGDFGFGLAILRISDDDTDTSDTFTGAVLRFPFGIHWSVTPKIDVIFEPAGFNVYFNSDDNRFIYTLSGGLLFKI